MHDTLKENFFDVQPYIPSMPCSQDRLRYRSVASKDPHARRRQLVNVPPYPAVSNLDLMNIDNNVNSMLHVCTCAEFSDADTSRNGETW